MNNVHFSLTDSGFKENEVSSEDVEKCAKLHFSAVIDAFLATMDNGQGIGNPQNAMGSPT